MVEKMNKLLIIVPSRLRSANAHRLMTEILKSSREGLPVSLMFAVESNDSSKEDYPQEITVSYSGGSMISTLNEAALDNCDKYDYIGFMGDDVLPRSENWLEIILSELEKNKLSIVYGNDLIHGEGLPTSVFMDSKIIKELGYMALPGAKQLFTDNYWKALGEELGTLSYLPHVILEHMHPLVGKAEYDSVYDESYSEQRWQWDRNIFDQHMSNQFKKDIEKLRNHL